jgi:hypothetical protein
MIASSHKSVDPAPEGKAHPAWVPKVLALIAASTLCLGHELT